MNEDRRKQIQGIIDKMQDALQELVDIESDEQDYYDRIPDGIQAGERGQKADDAITELSEAQDSINEAIGKLETAMQ